MALGRQDLHPARNVRLLQGRLNGRRFSPGQASRNHGRGRIAFVVVPWHTGNVLTGHLQGLGFRTFRAQLKLRFC